MSAPPAHIDHGKTALVRALTGVDTDRLPEEKKRGISIELGYAYTQLADGQVLGFVDVPGHEKFVHTMLAGATGIDYALLVIAADDGVMPQTREHLSILHLLGISRGAVALTKIDRVDAQRTQEVTLDITRLLATTRLARAPVFAVSSTTGLGIEALRPALAAAASEIAPEKSGSHFRLAVDRSFTLTGIGVVVTGTVFSGTIRAGAPVLIAPKGKPARVRSLHSQNRAAGSGSTGQRCALNLTGINKDDVARGDWIVAEPAHNATEHVDVRLWLARDETGSLKHWTPVHVHLGAAHVSGRVALLNEQEIQPGGSALAQLVLATPIAALHGDRFIVRDQSARRTVGGGLVLDPFSPARHRRSTARLQTLAALERATPRECLDALLADATYGIDLKRFALSFNLLDDAIAGMGLAMQRVRVRDADLGFSITHWNALHKRALGCLRDFHAKFPEQQGPDAARLRRSALPQLDSEACAALIEQAIHDGGIVKSGAWLHLPGHSVRFSDKERRLGEQILPLLADGRFDPPWVRDLAANLRVPEGNVRLLLQRLTRRGDVFQVVPDLFYTLAAVSELARIATAIQESCGSVQAAAFRDRTGLGRKRAIQILEFFDRIGYTRRVNDAHIIRTDNLLKLDFRAQSDEVVGV